MSGEPASMDRGVVPGARMEHATLMAHLGAIGAASETLNSWIAGAQNLALVRAALAGGVLEATRTARTPGEIAAVTGLPEGQVSDLCAALEARSVLDRQHGAYQLSPPFARLTSSEVIVMLPDILAAAEVLIRTLEDCTRPSQPYTTLPSADLLAVAANAGTFPWSVVAQGLIATVVDAMPEVKEVWESGALHLELGCGIGGWLLTPLVLFPRLRTVGVELDGAIVAEVRRRAEIVHVAARVEARQADACDLAEEAVYDTALWSQQFFPAESRARALAAARRALKPGGLLIQPILFSDPPESTEALREPAGRTFTLNKMVYSHWGVPIYSAAALREEAEQAGFGFIRIVDARVARFLLVQRP